MAGVRNGADVLLKSLFVGFGGRDGLIAFGALLLGTGATLVWRDLQRSGSIRPRYFLFMAAESVAYALLFGMVVGLLTGILLGGVVLARPAGTAAPVADLSLAAQLVISLGAGIYEELLFRVLLVGSLAWLGAGGVRLDGARWAASSRRCRCADLLRVSLHRTVWRPARAAAHSPSAPSPAWSSARST